MLYTSARQEYASILDQLDWKAENGETKENSQVLFQKLVPFLSRYISRTHDYGNVRSSVIQLILYGARYENGSSALLRSLFEQMAANRDFKRFFETEPEELYAVLTGSEGKKGNIYGDIFGALVERGAKGEAGLEHVQDFYQLMRGMLVNESVYMSVNHFVLPFQYQGKEAVSEFWIDPDAEKKEEEKDELFKKIKAGDKASRETYIKGNLRLVLSVIKRFNNHNENVDDLFQIGCIGLMKAIDNFDTSVGVKFSTYAVPMIIGEIRRYLRDNSSYRIPRSLRDIAYKAMQAKERLAKNAQKEPTLEEIANECEIPVEDVVYALDAIQTPLSLFDPVYTDGGDTLYVMDQISDKKNKEEHWVEDLSLSDALSHLNERDEHIIRLRFFEGKTQIEVADEIHILQAQVSRLEKNALKSMQGYLRT